MIVDGVAVSYSVLVSTVLLVIVDVIVVSDSGLVSIISLVIVDGIVSDSVVVTLSGQTGKLDADIFGMICAELEQESVNSDPGAAPEIRHYK